MMMFMTHTKQKQHTIGDMILERVDLGDITETKKLFLLDKISTIVTKRILAALIHAVPDDKRDLFIAKINQNKDQPDKIILFIDHFIPNAGQIIDAEIARCSEEILQKIQGSRPSNTMIKWCYDV